MTATKSQAKFIETLASRVGQDRAIETWREIIGTEPTYGLKPVDSIGREVACCLSKSDASALIDALLAL